MKGLCPIITSYVSFREGKMCLSVETQKCFLWNFLLTHLIMSKWQLLCNPPTKANSNKPLKELLLTPWTNSRQNPEKAKFGFLGRKKHFLKFKKKTKTCIFQAFVWHFPSISTTMIRVFFPTCSLLPVDLSKLCPQPWEYLDVRLEVSKWLVSGL